MSEQDAPTIPTRLVQETPPYPDTVPDDTPMDSDLSRAFLVGVALRTLDEIHDCLVSRDMLTAADKMADLSTAVAGSVSGLDVEDEVVSRLRMIDP